MKPQYRLYNRVGSGGFVVEIALAMVGAEVDLIELDSQRGTPLPASFRQVNPWGQVPTLVLPDGATLTECSAILIHLAACHPDRGLAPPPGTAAHGQFLRWMVFTSVNVYEAVLRRAYPERYSSDPDHLDGIRRAAVARMGQALEVLETVIEPGLFLLGPQMGVLDVYVAMLNAWFVGRVDTPRLAMLTERVRQHPTVAPIWRRHVRGV